MRADNHGEGGILALTALVMPASGQSRTRIGTAVVTLGVFGTALLYGDGLITPAISVLSAVEGFEVATSAFEAWVVPVAIVILVGLFAVQRMGTAGIARVFSPVMVVWFVTLGVLGIRHTSSRHIGQVYVPFVNWMLMIGCVGLVLAFRTSSALASAYGIAVTMTMLITTLIFYRVVRDRWGWTTRRAALVLVPFLLVDVAFFAANVPKIPTGGWFPLLVGTALVIQMTTWRRGRQLVAARIRRGERPIGEVTDEALHDHVARVPGTAVYLFKDAGAAPPALIANLRHNKVLHEMTMLVSVEIEDIPRVAMRRRARYTRISSGIVQVRLHFGFMDEPDVPAALNGLTIPGYAPRGSSGSPPTRSSRWAPRSRSDPLPVQKPVLASMRPDSIAAPWAAWSRSLRSA